MKILLVHCEYHQPGGEDVVFEKERGLLERAGHKVVLYRRSNREVSSYRGLQRLVLLGKSVWNGDTKEKFSELLRSEKPDIVHVHNTWIMVSPSIFSACCEAGVPVVQTLHNYRMVCPGGSLFRDGKVCEECLDRSLWRGVRYRCYRDSTAETAGVALMLMVHRSRNTWEREVSSFIAPTQFARRKLLQGGLPANKVFVKPNFVDPDPGPRSGDGGYAIFAGRLSPEGRIATLLDAWTHLRSCIRLKIIGGGEARERLTNRAIRDGLDMVEFTGSLPHDQTIAAIRGASFLIVSSEWYETFGLTMIEAFACGVPVICSRLGAMQEIVEDGRTGLHFTPGDGRDLAKKIEWAWSHPERMRQMGEEARREYELRYTAERNYPLLMQIYRQAISGRDLPSAELSDCGSASITAEGRVESVVDYSSRVD